MKTVYINFSFDEISWKYAGLLEVCSEKVVLNKLIIEIGSLSVIS